LYDISNTRRIFYHNLISYKSIDIIHLDENKKTIMNHTGYVPFRLTSKE